MKRIFRIAIAVAMLFVAEDCRADTLSAALSAASAPDWSARSTAYATLSTYLQENGSISSSKVDAVHLALIGLLKKESFAPADVRDNELQAEARSDYYSSLIGTVADLHDLRAVSVLTSSSVVSSGNMAVRGVAYFGSGAAQTVLLSFKRESDPLARTAFTRIFSQMLTNGSEVAASDRAALLQTLVECSHDTDPFVRLSAIEGLAADSNKLSIVRELANTDPYSVNVAGRAVYPVRDLATLMLTRQGSGTQRRD